MPYSNFQIPHEELIQDLIDEAKQHQQADREMGNGLNRLKEYSVHPLRKGMIMPLRLTIQEWTIVINQCYRCKYWDSEDGCTLAGGYPPHPVGDCLEYSPCL